MTVEASVMIGKRLRVLLVEDMDDVREVFTMLLTSEGFSVVSNASGRSAIESASRQDFDVLICDLGLPDLAGDAVIRTILAGALHRPRVIVVTGFGEPHTTRARQAGADVILIKPVTWGILRSHLTPAALGAVA
jgi:two-component system CheB/CheR fusion protein